MDPNGRIIGRELSGTRARVERTAGRPGNPQRAQAANAVSGVRSNEGLGITARGELLTHWNHTFDVLEGRQGFQVVVSLHD